MSRSGCLLAREDVPFFGMAVESDKQSAVDDFSTVELALATRNHGLPLEALRYDLTPVGLHYLLIHFDIPAVDASHGGSRSAARSDRPLTLSLDEIRARPAATRRLHARVRRQRPRPPRAAPAQPAMARRGGRQRRVDGHAARAAARGGRAVDDAVEILFTGLDRGVQGEVEHAYERSLPLDEALRAGGAPRLRDQRPAPAAAARLPAPADRARLVRHDPRQVARADHAVTEPFEGYQQASSLPLRSRRGDPGDAGDEDPPALAARCRPASPTSSTALAVPRRRAPCMLEGRAWSGWRRSRASRSASTAARRWADAALGEPTGDFGWRGWTYDWDAAPGEHELCSRATDARRQHAAGRGPSGTPAAT